ncbi:hypothetical protein LTR37_001658 [Vermiconidia calcicola]|uniref:Uncharacterized protein n=1 Tax=Vermiconidia calcicola TaxID=1690605 RepID=A0ACC3NWD2_9PEZI|nr:hypothetical protein LTR37_001658 [Vermiconidia calcicola]
MPTRLAFFGATGGCAGTCLAAALEAGHTCTALARTPSKLEATVLDRGASADAISSNLTIIHGDVRDLPSVQRTIADADLIISGVGAYPRFQLSLRTPLLSDDSTICADATSTILKACQSLPPPASGKRKPTLNIISTAGVQEQGKPRALPLAYLPWYGWLLADPLADKIVMEDIVLAHMELPEDQRGIDGYVMVKPSILTDGRGKNVEDVRAGQSDCPPVGYSVDRDLVGLWMLRRLVREDGARGEWKNSRVTITS